MQADSAGARQEPEILVDTAALSEAEWLAWRRKGIGGSDVAAILGISPWRTARDLYNDKLGIASAQVDSANWVALEMGHLLEDLVARIFSQKTRYQCISGKKDVSSPKAPLYAGRRGLLCHSAGRQYSNLGDQDDQLQCTRSLAGRRHGHRAALLREPGTALHGRYGS